MTEGADGELLREIETRLGEAMSRFGVAGEVLLEDGRALLRGAGVTVSTDATSLIAQWDQLTGDARQRACTDVARRLVAERRSSQAPLPPPAGTPYVWWVVAGVGLMFAAGVLLGRPLWSGRGEASQEEAAKLRRRTPDPVASAAYAQQQERDQRAAGVCRATVDRVARGATVGPTDTEGWVVEITLLSNRSTQPLTSHAVLAAFVARAPGKSTGRFVWTEATELAQIQGPGTRVEIGDAGVQGPAAPDWRGVTLTFTGRYVPPYFDQTQRLAYLRVAHALAEQVGASHAGLYARCAGGRTHHLGAWFRGASAHQAATALVYFMGAFALRPQVPAELRDPDGGVAPGRGRAVAAIGARTATLSRERLATQLGAQDGMITGPKDGPAIITFPFRDGNRATRASHQIATFLGLATPL